MKNRAIPWIHVVSLVLLLLAAVAAVAFPLIVTEAALANFLPIVELVIRLSS
jgi:hypothetical protein